MSSKHLPPVRHLPHWSRVGCLDRSGFHRRFPLPPVPGRETVGAAAEPGHGDTDPRVASLRRNIEFLQQQHGDTLERLHAEVDRLRRENRELQYKLIMELPKDNRKDSRLGIRTPTWGSDTCVKSDLEESGHNARPAQDHMLRHRPGADLKGTLISSLQPLRIHSSPSQPPRAPTLQECEVIIRQLYTANSFQSQEITRMKALLRDVVLRKKITPENYILTKAYGRDGACKSSEDQKCPKLCVPTLLEKTPGGQHGVMLPALKPSLSSSAADRQRRTRAVQRGRFKAAAR